MNYSLLFGLLLINAACAMNYAPAGASNSTGPAIVAHSAKGYTYLLNPDRAITFVWRNGTEQALTAEQVIRLDSAVIWAILREDQNTTHGESVMVIDDAISRATVHFLCALLDCYVVTDPCPDRYQNPILEQPQTMLLPSMSQTMRTQLINLCNFLEAAGPKKALAQIRTANWQTRISNWWQQHIQGICKTTLAGMVAIVPFGGYPYTDDNPNNDDEPSDAL